MTVTDGHRKSILKRKKSDIVEELIYRIEHEMPEPKVITKVVTKIVADTELVRKEALKLKETNADKNNKYLEKRVEELERITASYISLAGFSNSCIEMILSINEALDNCIDDEVEEILKDYRLTDENRILLFKELVK